MALVRMKAQLKIVMRYRFLISYSFGTILSLTSYCTAVCVEYLKPQSCADESNYVVSEIRLPMTITHT